MNKKVILLALSIITIAIVSCTAGPNNLSNTVNSQGEVAGFWQGLWHGLIAIVTFVISLFKDSVTIYEVHNNGVWYNFGFMVGIMAIFSGGCKSTCSKK